MLEKWKSLSREERQSRIEEQEKVEQILLLGGTERYWRDYNRAPDEGKPEQALLESAVDHLTPIYQAWIDDCVQSQKSPEWLPPLLAVGAQKMADLTIRCVIRLFLSRSTLSNLDTSSGFPTSAPTAQQVSKAIADDVIAIVAYQDAKSKNRKDWLSQSKFTKNWTPKRCKAFTKKVNSIPKYTTKQREDFGHNLLRIALESNILETRLQHLRGHKKILLVSLTPHILKELQEQHSKLDILNIVYRPMVCPPAPYTFDQDGGFLTTEMRKKLIKRYIPIDDHEPVKLSKPSSVVLTGVNVLMETEWCINSRILEIMETMFKNNHRVSNIPAHDFEDFAFSRPYPKEGTKQEKAIWMREASEAWGDWYKEEQARSRMLVRLGLARKLDPYGLFYMPYTMDFRGRAYSSCELLSCQSSDFDRGLILFANPIPLTDAGERWLKIHIANLFDQDKKSFEDRIKWTDDNLSMLKRINDDPFAHRDWLDDKTKKSVSFQRLAAVLEFFRTDGMTQLPIQMDGANNGSQHWAAIMNDNFLGELCNLVPSGKPMDLYQHVANVATGLLQESSDEMATIMLDHWGGALPRSLTKRSTMCDSYGLTFYGIQKYIKQEGHLDFWPKETRNRAVVFLARMMQRALQITMDAPNKGKAWLRMVAAVCNKEKKPLIWVTPSGFEVYHMYNVVNERVSYAQLFNKSQLVFSTVESEMDTRAQFMGVSPNFIHSLDAAHMFLVINKAVKMGINAFSFIHDSFGTYASDIGYLQTITRDQFVKMHTKNQLHELKGQLEERYDVTLPDPPTDPGTLDLCSVLQSPYFFS